MKVVLLDPSFFSFPYDHHMAQALVARGHVVVLFGRRFRRHEERPAMAYTYSPLFYKFSEGIVLLIGKNFFTTCIKGCEHVINMLQVVRQVRMLQPDVLHMQWSPFPLVDRFAVLLLKSIPIIFTVHDSNPFHGEQTSSLQRAGCRNFLKNISALIVHTEYSKRQLMEKGTVQNKITIIPHGILSSFCVKRDGHDSRLFARNKTVGAQWRIVIFGAIKKYKGVDILVRAFALIPAEAQKHVEIVIAGVPKMNTRTITSIAQRAGIMDRCVFMFRHLSECEVDILLESADIIVFPYTESDASGALMRALPFGKPIITSRVGGFAELFSATASQHLFSPRDDKQLSIILSNFISDRSLYEKAIDEIAAVRDRVPSWDEIAKSTEALYTRAVQHKKKT